MDRPTVGRMVHYVLPTGECRSAVLARLCEPQNENEAADLTVFSTRRDVTFLYQVGAAPVVDVPHQEGKPYQSGTWHWPEREPALAPRAIPAIPEVQ